MKMLIWYQNMEMSSSIPISHLHDPKTHSVYRLPWLVPWVENLSTYRELYLIFYPFVTVSHLESCHIHLYGLAKQTLGFTIGFFFQGLAMISRKGFLVHPAEHEWLEERGASSLGTVGAVVSRKVGWPQESWTCQSVRVNKTWGLEGRGRRVARSFLLHLTHSAVKCGQPGPKGDVAKQKVFFFILFPRPEPVLRSGTQWQRRNSFRARKRHYDSKCGGILDGVSVPYTGKILPNKQKRIF